VLFLSLFKLVARIRGEIRGKVNVGKIPEGIYLLERRSY